MAKQGTDSVVVVLSELRQIEDQRVAKKVADRVAEAERERHTREAIERARAEEKAQRERAERARQEQARLEADIAERRAAIEAQMQIEARRVEVETEVAALRDRQTGSKHHWFTVALLSVVVAGQAVLLYSQWQRERELHRLIDKYETEARARPAALPADLAPDLAQDLADTDVAGTALPSESNQPTSATRPRRKRPERPKKARPDTAPSYLDCDPNDPLGCLPKRD